jgi:hypothetical protein
MSLNKQELASSLRALLAGQANGGTPPEAAKRDYRKGMALFFQAFTSTTTRPFT